MENTPIPGEGPGGLDRRTVLRRGAILGGALVWTVPAVQTLAGPAFAAGSPCIGKFQYSDDRGVCVKVQYLADNDCCDCISTTAAALAASGPAGVPASAYFSAAAFLCQSPGGPCKLDLANSGTC